MRRGEGGGLKLKFGGPSRALYVRGFIGEIFKFRVSEIKYGAGLYFKRILAIAYQKI